uniref:Uncharacterized protein n=1 Tax=Physcomitrium patens TaxID=3218 RepID=A0A2K1KZQ5_PHYPA|nr:hypothetical protein PHYPA_002049 [Physcomitrium patens]
MGLRSCFLEQLVSSRSRGEGPVDESEKGDVSMPLGNQETMRTVVRLNYHSKCKRNHVPKKADLRLRFSWSPACSTISALPTALPSELHLRSRSIDERHLLLTFILIIMR